MSSIQDIEVTDQMRTYGEELTNQKMQKKIDLSARKIYCRQFEKSIQSASKQEPSKCQRIIICIV